MRGLYEVSKIIGFVFKVLTVYFFHFFHLKRLMQQCFKQLLGGLLVGDDVFFMVPVLANCSNSSQSFIKPFFQYMN